MFKIFKKITLGYVLRCLWSSICFTAVLPVMHNAYAQTTPSIQSQIAEYTQKMQQAANAQNIGQIARLIDDDAAITLSRGAMSVSLDKTSYLKLLQKNWTKASDYSFSMSAEQITTADNRTRVQFLIQERWKNDGKDVQMTTDARATLEHNGKYLVLTRLVSDVSVR